MSHFNFASKSILIGGNAWLYSVPLTSICQCKKGQILVPKSRAEQRLRMSQNCLEKLGDTKVFSCTFAIELSGQLSASVGQGKDETVVFKIYFAPLLQDGL